MCDRTGEACRPSPTPAKLQQAARRGDPGIIKSTSASFLTADGYSEDAIARRERRGLPATCATRWRRCGAGDDQHGPLCFEKYRVLNMWN